MNSPRLKSNEKVQLLTSLGLTLNQATVFFALADLGASATVKTISRASTITREKVYCILPRLQEIGLVEKVLNSPSEFKAISLKKAISLLLERITSETASIKKNAQEVLQNLEEIEKLEQNSDEETIVVCKHEIGFDKRIRAMENAKVSLDLIIPELTEETGNYYLGVYSKALRKGAHVRLIAQKPIQSRSVLETAATLSKNPMFEIRYSKSASPAMSLYVIDEKQVTIATSAETFPKNYSVILARTPVLVALTLGYFKTMWNAAFTPEWNRPQERPTGLHLE
jgi:sugar-specific transcriptional regulator TrmB